MLKRIVCFVVVAAFVLGTLAACNRGNGGGDGAADHPSGLAPVTLRVMVLGGTDTPRTDDILAEINRILTDRINTTIEIQRVLQEAYDIVLVGLNDVDLITSADFLRYFDHARQGAFQPIPREMIQTYMPQWYAYAARNLQAATVDGNIYAIPNPRPLENAPIAILRRDWFPPGLNSIDSMEDLYTYLAHVRDTQPQILMPWVMNTGEITWINGAFMFGAVFLKAPGAPSCVAPVVMDKRDYPDFRLVRNWEQPQIVYYLEWFRRFHEAGFWTTDVLDNPMGMGAAFNEGLSGIRWTLNTQAFEWLYPHMRRVHPEAELYAFDWGYRSQVPVDQMAPMGGAVSIPRNGTNMARSLMLQELMFTDAELNRVWEFGIRGVDYNLNEAGEVYRLDEDGVWPAGFSIPGLNRRLWPPPEGGRWPGHDALDAQIASRFQLNPFIGFGMNTDVSPAISAFGPNHWAQHMELGMLLYLGMSDDIQATLDQFNSTLEQLGIDVWEEELYRQLQEFLVDAGLDDLYTIAPVSR